MLKHMLLTAAALAVIAAPAAAYEVADMPVSFGVSYTLVSDYIFRGANRSEYATEGSEDFNHQLDVSAGIETPVGTFGGGAWFEWFAGQEQLTPTESSNLQEVDYYISWAYDFAEYYTSVEVGYIYYDYPRVSGPNDSDDEIYLSLAFDDSVLFGTEESVLNPTVTYYYNLDLSEDNSWIELAFSHDFPVYDNLVVTPSFVMGIEHRYWTGSTTKIANLLYGVAATYDLSTAFEIPEAYGAWTVTGFVNMSQAIMDDILNDEFYGGMTVGVAW